MAETLRLFISATSDLEAERNLIGTTLAQLPAHNRVEIRRTPASGDTYSNIFERIANCDRVFFLLGQDITAPAGQEWYLALELERHIFPIRKDVNMTPAGLSFLRGSLVKWQRFRHAADLEQIVTRNLIRTLLNPHNRYGLTMTERHLLQTHRFHSAPVEEGVRPRGAEGGGVLLDQRDPDTVIGVKLDEEAL